MGVGGVGGDVWKDKRWIKVVFQIGWVVCICCMCVFHVHVFGADSKLGDVRLYLLVFFPQPAIPHVWKEKAFLPYLCVCVCVCVCVRVCANPFTCDNDSCNAFLVSVQLWDFSCMFISVCVCVCVCVFVYLKHALGIDILQILFV